MKKKYRDIAVDNEMYAWSTKRLLDGDNMWLWITIWKNKKVIITKSIRFTDDRNPVTPSVVANLIKEYNKELK